MPREIEKRLNTRKDKSEFFLHFIGKDEYSGMKKYLLVDNANRPKAEWESYIIYSDGPGLQVEYLNNPKYVEVLTEVLLSKERLKQKVDLAEKFTGQREHVFVGHISPSKKMEKNNNFNIVTDRVAFGLIKQSIDEETKQKSIPIQNLQTDNKNIEQCKETVEMGGHGFDKAEGDMSLGRDMFASTRIGKRENQQDSVLLMQHSRNDDFKMMVVADGIGEGEEGEKASADVINGLKEWFGKVDIACYSNYELLMSKLLNELHAISGKMAKKYPGNNDGSTVVVTIIGKETALIANVGNSRAYFIEDGELKQITKDHSFAGTLYEAGNMKKDDIRFYKHNNKISQKMGSPFEIYPDIYIRDRADFDAILMFSAGVTDILSDDDILVAAKETRPQELTKRISELSLTKKSKRRSGLNEDKLFIEETTPGKDNASVSAFFNEKKSYKDKSKGR